MLWSFHVEFWTLCTLKSVQHLNFRLGIQTKEHCTDKICTLFYISFWEFKQSNLRSFFAKSVTKMCVFFVFFYSWAKDTIWGATKKIFGTYVTTLAMIFELSILFSKNVPNFLLALLIILVRYVKKLRPLFDWWS